MDRLLPDPDSPTTPSVSPGWTSKLTPSTAANIPRAVGKPTVQVPHLECRRHEDVPSRAGCQQNADPSSFLLRMTATFP